MDVPLFASGVLKRNAAGAKHDRGGQGCEVRPELQSAEKSRRTEEWSMGKPDEGSQLKV